jgi:hypothetical protein
MESSSPTANTQGFELTSIELKVKVLQALESDLPVDREPTFTIKVGDSITFGNDVCLKYYVSND